jgi:4-hydroxy-tetrahydrodipicolinate synthase
MFHGSIVAVVTPFQHNQVDVTRLRQLVEFHINEGTQAIVAAGTTGESGTLSHEEKLLVIKTVIEAAKERLPVIAGTGMQTIPGSIQLTQEAMDLGAHAALMMTPAYIKPTQEGLYQYYSQIAKAVSLPIILYNVPSRTACDLLPETVARLADISNIIGIKEATGQMPRLEQLLALLQGRMDVFSGDDITAAEWMLAGAKGVISVTANVVPRMMAKLSDFALDKNHAETSRLQADLLPLHQALFVESNPIPVKWVLHRMGLIGPDLRLPLTTLSSTYHEKLAQVMQALALIH